MRTTLQNPKRLIAVIASLMLILIVACGSSAAPAGDTTTTQPAQSAQQAQPAQPAQQVQPAQPAQQQPGSDTPAQEAPGSSAAQEPAMRQAAPTAAPQVNVEPMAAEARLERLGVAVGAQSYDTNYSYKVIISGYLDKRPVLEWLVGVDRYTGEYEPQLAESWEMAPNGKDWTFKLREGVEFHDDWGEFTAQDVRHSAWLLVSPTSTASGISTWRQYQGVSKTDEPETVMEKSSEFIEIVDDHTVILHNQSVFPEALYQFGYRRNLPMESKARWDGVGGDEAYGAKIIGTGPLKFVERIEGSHVSYEAVDEHWRVVPQYKELEFRWVGESSTRVAALLTNQVQIADIERALREEIIAQGMTFIPAQFGELMHRWTFSGNYHTTPEKLDPDNPFLNQKVRLAMAKAINREAITQALLPGFEVKIGAEAYYPFDTKLAEQQWPGIINPDWAANWEAQYGYDPEGARQLLAEAGYADGLEFSIALYTVSGLPEVIDIGQAMALDFEAVGMKPKLEQWDFPKIRSGRRSRELHGVLFPGATTGDFSLYGIQTNFYSKGTVRSFEHPDLDAVFEQLQTTLVPEERAKILQEMGNLCFELVCSLPMFAIAPDIAANPKYVKDYIYPGFINSFYTHLEYVETVPQ
jgi:peptide/nickel transport system substrate-binding protein